MDFRVGSTLYDEAGCFVVGIFKIIQLFVCCVDNSLTQDFYVPSTSSSCVASRRTRLPKTRSRTLFTNNKAFSLLHQAVQLSLVSKIDVVLNRLVPSCGMALISCGIDMLVMSTADLIAISHSHHRLVYE